MAFPPYRRSHLRSNTYHALVHLLSHLAEYNASHQTPTQPLNIPDNDSGRMDGVNQEKEPKCSEVVDSDFLDPKDPISQKDIPEVQEIIEGVGDKDMDFTSNKMILEDIEHMMGIEDMSTQVNGSDKEQELINEFELVMKGTEDLICDSGLIPLNTGFDEKHNDGCEVGLMDSQVDMEEGEISGDLGKNGNSFDVSSADALILRQIQVDDVQKPVSVIRNMIHPSMIKNQEKEKGCDSTSSMVNSLQEANDSGQVEPITGGNKGIACRVEVAISEETECKKEDKAKLLNASKRKNRGGNKEKKKMVSRMKRAKKNRELGVKSLQLQKYIQKPKVVSHCRHYLAGRCHEGDKCNFSHDVVPRTKSKPCSYLALHSCMKGDDCPFDHQLSKYPCNNIVSQGFCRRGETCLFSHQVPSKEDIPTPSNVCRPVLSTLQSGNAKSSTPPSNNHGSGSVPQNLLTHSSGIHSRINVEHKVTNTAQKQPTPPKGISFINPAKLTPCPSTLKQGTVTIKESPLQTGIHEDQSAFDKTQNKMEIANKLPSVTPKGVNFLSFGKGSVCGFKSHIRPKVSIENGFKLPQLLNFGLTEQANSSLNKDDYNKASDRTKQSVSLSDIFLNEILGKNQSVSEGMKSKFPDKASATPSPLVSIQSSEHLKSGYHKHASNSGQKALLSTLAFAAEHDSDIKMKCPSGESSA